MMKSNTTRKLATTLVVGAAAFLVAQSDDEPKYLGVEACKTCHTKDYLDKFDDEGERLSTYGVWKKNDHSRSFETLKTDVAKAVAENYGVENPETAEECLQCHAPHFDLPEVRTAETFDYRDGVQCETCHGAAENYLSLHNLKSKKDEALLAGLIKPDSKIEWCKTCHDDHHASDPIPDFTPFDFERDWEIMSHTGL
jgi:hypothetical protein